MPWRLLDEKGQSTVLQAGDLVTLVNGTRSGKTFSEVIFSRGAQPRTLMIGNLGRDDKIQCSSHVCEDHITTLLGVVTGLRLERESEETAAIGGDTIVRFRVHGITAAAPRPDTVSLVPTPTPQGDLPKPTHGFSRSFPDIPRRRGAAQGE